MLDARVLARGLGYNLDVRQGAWSWRSLNGISGSGISGTQAAAIRAVRTRSAREALTVSLAWLAAAVPALIALTPL